MKDKARNMDREKIKCAKCDILLEPGRVELTYLGNTFPTVLLKCPKCGQIFIPETVVKGKILEVEMTLEDK